LVKIRWRARNIGRNFAPMTAGGIMFPFTATARLISASGICWKGRRPAALPTAGEYRTRSVCQLVCSKRRRLMRAGRRGSKARLARLNCIHQVTTDLISAYRLCREAVGPTLSSADPVAAYNRAGPANGRELGSRLLLAEEPCLMWT
jgi:hypothetical protein